MRDAFLVVEGCETRRWEVGERGRGIRREIEESSLSQHTTEVQVRHGDVPSLGQTFVAPKFIPINAPNAPPSWILVDVNGA